MPNKSFEQFDGADHPGDLSGIRGEPGAAAGGADGASTGHQASAEDLAQLILDTAEEGFCLFSAEAQRVVAFNRQFADFLNLETKWLAAHPTAEEVAKAIYDRERHRPGHNLTGYLQRVLGRHQQSGDWEMELHLADGRTIVGRTQAAATGERLYTARDITRQRQIIHELESERQRLSSMVEHAPVAYYMIDCESGSMVEMSRSIQNLTGYSAETFPATAEEWLARIHEADRGYVEAVRTPAIQVREAFDIQYRRIHADGSVRWLREMAEMIPVREEDRDRPAQMTGVLVEITEQKTAEAKLREGERRFRELIEGIPDLMFYEHDPDRRLTYVSPSVEGLIGFSPEEMIGKRFGEFWDGDGDGDEGAGFGRGEEGDADDVEDDADMQEAYRFVAEAIRTGRRQPRYEIRVRNRAGKTVVLGVHEYPVTDSAGVVIGFRGVARDVTAMRVMERQMRERERLAILGTFAGGLAHDLNNLLLPIRASLETLERQPDPATIEARVKAIRQATDLAEDLVKKLLFWTRQDSSMGSRAFVVDLRVWADRALEFLQESVVDGERSAAQAVRVELKYGLPAEAVAIDPELLQQAILNLVLNSKDAMPEGGTIRLLIEQSPADWVTHLQVEAEDDEMIWSNEGRGLAEDGDSGGRVRGGRRMQAAVRFTVADEGMGMPESVTDRVFDPFFSTKPRGQSTGLGLALVRAIVQSAGGAVHIESTRGVGTSIHIDIPEAVGERRRRSTAVDRAISAGRAVIRVADPMASAFIASCLAQLGLEARVAVDELPGIEDCLWVVNAGSMEATMVERGLADNVNLRVLALGECADRGTWPTMRVIWHDGPIEIEMLRDRLREVIDDGANSG